MPAPKFRWYRPAPNHRICFFDDHELRFYRLGATHGADPAHAHAPPKGTARQVFAYGRGFATARATLTTPRGRRLDPRAIVDDRFTSKVDQRGNRERVFDDWTLANDKRLRASIAAKRGQEGPHMTFVNDQNADHRAQTNQPATRMETTHMPRTRTKAPTASLATKLPEPVAASMARITGDAEAKSAAARKAWETRRANGWTHPASGNSPRSVAPAAEPIKRASLSAIASGALDEASRKRAAEISAVPPPPTADAQRIRDARAAKRKAAAPVAKPARKKVRTPAKRPAKKAPAKKASSARGR